MEYSHAYFKLKNALSNIFMFKKVFLFRFVRINNIIFQDIIVDQDLRLIYLYWFICKSN